MSALIIRYLYNLQTDAMCNFFIHSLIYSRLRAKDCLGAFTKIFVLKMTKIINKELFGNSYGYLINSFNTAQNELYS